MPILKFESIRVSGTCCRTGSPGPASTTTTQPNVAACALQCAVTPGCANCQSTLKTSDLVGNVYLWWIIPLGCTCIPWLSPYSRSYFWRKCVQKCLYIVYNRSFHRENAPVERNKCLRKSGNDMVRPGRKSTFWNCTFITNTNTPTAAGLGAANTD